MHRKFLIAASALAIMTSGLALAETDTNTSADTQTQVNTPQNPSMKDDVKHAWESTKE